MYMSRLSRQNSSRSKDQKVPVTAALFNIYFHQLAFISWRRSDDDYLVKQNCVVNKIWNMKSTQHKCLK